MSMQSSTSAFISASIIFWRGVLVCCLKGLPISDCHHLRLSNWLVPARSRRRPIAEGKTSTLSPSLLEVIVCLVHVPVGGSSGSWQGAATSSSRVITPWSWLGPTAKSQHRSELRSTEAVPVLRSQVPKALLGARPQADKALGGDPQVLLLRSAGAYQKGTCTLSAAPL
jgi:hypothetical protein